MPDQDFLRLSEGRGIAEERNAAAREQEPANESVLVHLVPFPPTEIPPSPHSKNRG
jgi:hypothetical protein